MAKVLDCNLKEGEFELLSCYHIQFQTNVLGKGMKPLIPLAMGEIISLLFFYNDGFAIKYLMKVDMPSIKETKTSNVSLSSLRQVLLD